MDKLIIKNVPGSESDNTCNNVFPHSDSIQCPSRTMWKKPIHPQTCIVLQLGWLVTRLEGEIPKDLSTSNRDMRKFARDMRITGLLSTKESIPAARWKDGVQMAPNGSIQMAKASCSLNCATSSGKQWRLERRQWKTPYSCAKKAVLACSFSSCADAAYKSRNW